MNKKLFIFISFWLIIPKIWSQDFGSPFIVNYTPKEYLGHSQIWSIIEDDRGIMYFGTTTELVEFDGESWRIIRLPKNSNVRSLCKSSITGKIYIGSSNEIGYLKPDSIGQMQYYSLLNLIDTADNNFSDVWEVFQTNEGIYFRSTQKIFRYNEQSNKITSWTPKTKFNPMSFVPGVGIIIRDNDDFFTIKEDKLIPLPNPKKYYGQFLYRMFPYENGKALCVGANNLFLYDFLAPEGTDPLTIFETDVDDIFSTTHLYMGCPIGDTAFAITSLTEGVFIIDKNGKLVERINKDDGLQFNHVWISFLSKNNTLWLGLDKGISRVDISSPIRFWNSKSGLDDGLNSVYRFNNSLVVAGMTGVYKIPFKTGGKITKFPGLTYNVWYFNEVKPTKGNEKQLLIASSKGIFSTKGDDLNFLNDVAYNYFTFQSKINPEIIYASSLDHVIAFKFENNKLIPIDTIDFKGLAIRNIEAGNNLWITTFFDGVYKVTVNPDSDVIFDKKIFKYDTLKGFKNSLQIKAYNIDNEVYFPTNKGLFKYDEKLDSIVLCDMFGKELTRENVGLGSFFNIKDNYYFVGNRKLYSYHKTDGKYIRFDTLKYKPLETKSLNFIYVDSSFNVYISGADGLYFIKPSDNNNYLYEYSTYIRKVSVGNDSVIFMGTYFDENGEIIDSQPQNFIHTIKYSNNKIHFEYSSPYFTADEHVTYSYKLENFDDIWSDWSRESKNKYTNLHEGTYTFMVKAKNIYGVESNVAKYTFKILPPWYRTIIAYIVYFILLVISIYFILRIFTNRLRRQNIRLEKEVNKRTQEINQQNEEILAKNEELMQQQEEILAQRDELETINVELEKLSIVASETENSVFLISAEGDFVWANAAFEKIYGFSYNEFIELHKNILFYVKDKKLLDMIKKTVFNNKKPFRYIAQIITKNEKKIWLQTTLTPILNHDKSIRVIAAIESDISKLKEFEREIVAKTEEIEIQNQILEQKNEMIESSIRYASTIQSSILPQKSVLDRYFENFILFRPKDVVSGDFYWLQETTDYLFFAVVDCTGHGVPGAFMSLIGSRILSEIVVERQVVSPAEILTQLDKVIINSLHQEDTDNQDGMDLIILRFNKPIQTNIKIVYSSAKRPIVYSKNNEIFRKKGIARSIGGYKIKMSKTKFQNFILELNSGDNLYLFTDGFTDQNNPEREKFKSSKLLKILKSVLDKSAEDQFFTLQNELDNWQKNSDQRDDITFIGLKIK